MWKIIPSEYTILVDVESEDGSRQATIKWDGCIHYNHINYYDKHDINYIHICDIDDEILYLQELKKKALEFFGEDWPL